MLYQKKKNLLGTDFASHHTCIICLNNSCAAVNIHVHVHSCNLDYILYRNILEIGLIDNHEKANHVPVQTRIILQQMYKSKIHVIRHKMVQ